LALLRRFEVFLKFIFKEIYIVSIRSFALVGLMTLAFSGAASAATTMGSDVNVTASGTKGISFAFPNGGGGVVSGSYFLSNNSALRIDLGLDLKKTDPADMTFGMSVEMGYRMYCAKAGNLTAFWQPSLFFSRPSVTSGVVTVGPSFTVGAEYWFSNNLSFGVNTGLNLTFTDTFKSFRLNTGTTAITGSLYW
jgi:hypothetical protein